MNRAIPRGIMRAEGDDADAHGVSAARGRKGVRISSRTQRVSSVHVVGDQELVFSLAD
jgi:hypothetical protein